MDSLDVHVSCSYPLFGSLSILARQRQSRCLRANETESKGTGIGEVSVFYQQSGGIDMAEPQGKPGTSLTEVQLKRIQEAVRDIRYGTVTLVIQDGRLIQIDRSEKIRLKSE